MKNRAIRRFLIFAVFILPVSFHGLAQDFAIQSVTQTGQVISVSVGSDTNSYYILNGAVAATGAFKAVAIDLGGPVSTLLSDAFPLPDPHFFYHVARNAVMTPLDTDGDGIDDVFELGLSGYLDALDPSDAQEDPDVDTVNNLREFQRRTDLTDPLSVNTSLYANADIGDDAFDGLSPVSSNGHGPKRTIQSAIDESVSGDDIHVAGDGSSYNESVWDLGGKNLILFPDGNVVVE
jgi:hypothetical protein